MTSAAAIPACTNNVTAASVTALSSSAISSNDRPDLGSKPPSPDGHGYFRRNAWSSPSGQRLQEQSREKSSRAAEPDAVPMHVSKMECSWSISFVTSTWLSSRILASLPVQFRIDVAIDHVVEPECAVIGVHHIRPYEEYVDITGRLHFTTSSRTEQRRMHTRRIPTSEMISNSVKQLGPHIGDRRRRAGRQVGPVEPIQRCISSPLRTDNALRLKALQSVPYSLNGPSARVMSRTSDAVNALSAPASTAKASPSAVGVNVSNG